MYYVYHIPGVKIGCSKNPKRRTKNQGFTEYEILEQLDDITIASQRERELQKKYGYRVDSSDYYKQMKMVKEAAKPHIRKKAVNNINQKERVIKSVATCHKLNYYWNKEGRKNKAVLQYDKNGCFIKEHESLKSAAESIGVRSGFITLVCKGKRKTAKGYTFKYAQD